jgi:PAS domain S-box-containing protein
MTWFISPIGAIPSTHAILWASIFASIAGVRVIERRGMSSEQLSSSRQVEIGTILESMPEAAVLFETQGRVLEANTAAEELCGCTRDQLIGMDAAHLAERLQLPGNSSEPFDFSRTAIARALRGDSVRHERRLLNNPQTGRPLEVLVSAMPVKNQNTSQIIGVLLTARDVTELGQLQRRLAETQRQNAVGQMAAGISHDFNNVLDTIVQAVALLEINKDKSAEDRQPYVDMIKRGVRRGSEIIKRIREYLRTGTGELTRVDVRNVLEEVLELILPLATATAGLRMKAELNPMPPIRGNVADLRRAFTNVIINGIEAMPNGGTLTVGCNNDRRFVHVYVKDTGHGMSPEQQRNIFVPYFTTKKEGTGLGLTGAQRTVVAQGGNISFRTQKDKGTTFYINLPIAKDEEALKRKTV